MITRALATIAVASVLAVLPVAQRRPTARASTSIPNWCVPPNPGNPGEPGALQAFGAAPLRPEECPRLLNHAHPWSDERSGYM